MCSLTEILSACIRVIRLSFFLSLQPRMCKKATGGRGKSFPGNCKHMYSAPPDLILCHYRGKWRQSSIFGAIVRQHLCWTEWKIWISFSCSTGENTGTGTCLRNYQIRWPWQGTHAVWSRSVLAGKSLAVLISELSLHSTPNYVHITTCSSVHLVLYI